VPTTKDAAATLQSRAAMLDSLIDRSIVIDRMREEGCGVFDEELVDEWRKLSLGGTCGDPRER